MRRYPGSTCGAGKEDVPLRTVWYTKSIEQEKTPDRRGPKNPVA
ncbi:hypothetical protein RB10751 [Rhodopirellula baltica SH 1]|uniref:Uncharacterized protein n=1 Tax=Rhodopirellula baltica (strain DSM 10527 / NCIMB 13988 / SH1) TaxID=243090 RepID=Q7UKA8_RHOBA|nr:hypothetical protein RB10751 [Rhodopirellula baltica SH 1]